MKHRLTLTTEEVAALAHVSRHFVDYMGGDDRPDHGLGILKGYREANLKVIHEAKSFTEVYDLRPTYVKAIISAMGKLYRLDRKIRFRK
jgi:hypothetical protein